MCRKRENKQNELVVSIVIKRDGERKKEREIERYKE